MYQPIETEARHQMHERQKRASEPHLPQVPPRHRFAERLRQLADRIDN